MDHDPLCPHTDIVKGLVKEEYCTYCTLIKQARKDERKRVNDQMWNSLFDDGK